MSPIALHAGNPGPMTGEGNVTWLIPGRVPTLVDAGVGHPRHLDELERALGRTPLAQVLVTHAHTDHAAGAVEIAARMGAVRFRKIPWSDRDSRWPVGWLPLADGDTVEAGDGSLTVLHTPGHSPDHACFWNSATGDLFGGDLAIAGTTVWVPASPSGDLAAYISSIERVLALNPARILPGHGRIISDPAGLLRQYVAHRLERERQIVDALRLGDATAGAIVSRIYPRLSEALLERAKETVLAHLEKLERDGVTHRVDEAWSIMKP